ncbi:MAG: hypothetical protein R3244_13660, partial [Thermoanaerobaculia bacterium]|nr:hypothetical protein [Thermoanaerobaculia bacterium]
NWLYIVDVETGQTLYKEQLLDPVDNSSGGAAVAEPAAVDTDGDGYLDRIYVGTLEGFLYRVDLRNAIGEPPILKPTFDFVEFSPGIFFGIGVEHITDPDFRPRLVFKAQPDPATAGPPSRAIYFRPSVIFSAGLGEYVIAFGVGDRENLWSSDGARGVFYLFRDDIGVGDPTFYTEADLVQIDSALDGDRADDLLTDPTLATKGWFLQLREDERLITNPFAVSGVVVFTVFEPDVAVDLESLTCSRTGRSRVFGVTATNANGLLFSGGQRTRWFDIADFVTEPYIEQSATKNPDSGNEGGNADELTADHLAIMDELKKLFPQNCKFANYRLDIKTLSSDTGIHLIAPIPICIVEKNWKEF